MNTGGNLQVVWFKRDLRVKDHAPLALAARQGPVLCLYLYEPDILATPDQDPSHVVFINQCLEALALDLARLGARLVTRHGEATDVLGRIHAQRGIHHLWSHEETGNLATYARDRRVAAFTREHGIPWTEVPQTGVVRRLGSRNGWAARWEERMRAPRVEPPVSIMDAGMDSAGVLTPEQLGLAPASRPGAQVGGTTAAWGELRTFLGQRGERYLRDISSPWDAAGSCSRLSPYLAHGCLSVREVYQLTSRRRDERMRMRGDAAGAGWPRALEGFLSRLRWHCHFMQKLEDHPAMENTAVNPALEDLRPRELDRARHDRFIHGMTGYPLVDACVRALHATGWLNFRMRAMLVSFYSHDLWMDWRHLAPWLGRHFVDLEAGIHYPQVQMQAGVTGINALRMYNPATQLRELAGATAFIRRHVPELSEVSDDQLRNALQDPGAVQPWAAHPVARHYPPPMVDHVAAIRQARARFAAVHRREETRRASQEVHVKHGSRSARRPWERAPRKRAPAQLEMDFAATDLADGPGSDG